LQLDEDALPSSVQPPAQAPPMPCTVHELGEAGVRLTHLLEQANNVSRQSGRRNHAQLEYVLTGASRSSAPLDLTRRD